MLRTDKGIIIRKKTRFGYCRVSTFEQNEDRQIAEMKKLKILRKNIYLDKESGRDFNRTQYKNMVGELHEGDIVYVLSIDRLGRNYSDIKEQWRILTKEKRVDIVVIDMPLLDTRIYKDLIGTFITDLVLQMLSFVAETEYEFIHKRQKEGIALAKARGVRFGRPPKMIDPKEKVKVIRQWEKNEKTKKEIMSEYDISKTTFYRWVNDVANK